MKIFYVAPYATKFPSSTASSIHMAKMAEAYAELGHDLVFCTSSANLDDDSFFDYYGVINNAFTLISKPSPMPKINRIIYSFCCAREASLEKADLLISRSFFPCWFAQHHNIDFVYDSHGPVWERNFLEFFLFKRTLSAWKFKKMATNSGSLKQMYIEKCLVPHCGIAVANNGVKKERPEVISNWPCRQGALQVGYFGHLYEGRGIDLLLRCAEFLSDVDFHFVGGNDSDISHWKKMAPSNAIFHGFVKPSQVGDYRAMVDVLVAPYSSSGVRVAGGASDSVEYMNPIKIFEYLSSSKPIICSDLKAIRDIIPEDVCVFADPDDDLQWIERIKTLRDSYNLRQRLEEATKQFFGERLSWRNRAKRLLDY